MANRRDRNRVIELGQGSSYTQGFQTPFETQATVTDLLEDPKITSVNDMVARALQSPSAHPGFPLQPIRTATVQPVGNGQAIRIRRYNRRRRSRPTEETSKLNVLAQARSAGIDGEWTWFDSAGQAIGSPVTDTATGTIFVKLVARPSSQAIIEIRLPFLITENPLLSFAVNLNKINSNVFRSLPARTMLFAGARWTILRDDISTRYEGDVVLHYKHTGWYYEYLPDPDQGIYPVMWSWAQKLPGHVRVVRADTKRSDTGVLRIKYPEVAF